MHGSSVRECIFVWMYLLINSAGMKAWLPPSCWWNFDWKESVAAPVLLVKPWLQWKRGCPRLVDETLAVMKAWLPASWRKMDGATGHACGSMLSLHRAAWILCGRGWCSHAIVLSIAWAPWGQKRSRAFLRWGILALCHSNPNEIFKSMLNVASPIRGLRNNSISILGTFSKFHFQYSCWKIFSENI